MIVYRNAGVTPKQTLLVRRSRGPGQIISEAMPPVYIHFEAQRLDDNIGYIRFNHFAAPVDQQFADALETLRDTRGLIFDLRGNPGGYFRIMDTIVAQLIRAVNLNLGPRKSQPSQAAVSKSAGGLRQPRMVDAFRPECMFVGIWTEQRRVLL